MTVEYIKMRDALCPEELVVIGGYSKGAMVVHSMKLPKYLKPKVIAIVVFGDPLYRLSIQWPIKTPVVNLVPSSSFDPSQNVLSFCNKGDVICGAGWSISAHWRHRKDNT
ncbi:cutinase [Rhizoctonia solani AG-3 Rhs1AP]|nr:cutinase [Rhizoctonia solani AG-3 Rhs1AP]